MFLISVFYLTIDNMTKKSNNIIFSILSNQLMEIKHVQNDNVEVVFNDRTYRIEHTVI